MVAQWFPKLGVYEVPGQRYVPADAPSGQWNTHQFHANSEFYADFGTYDVSISVPSEYVVGATGLLVDEQESAGGLKTVRYVAEDVHDFAWTASPTFREYTRTWKHVNIRLLIRPEHRGQVDRHFTAAIHALDYFDRWVGEYPYTTLTLVDGYGESNGMEYPTLITCGTFYGMPKWLRLLELVTIHEFGHQYFYGMLASNEAEEAWLDEGMNSYLETRIMDAAYGPGSAIDLPGLRISDSQFQRLNYTENRPESGALFTRSWEYQGGDYGKASYAKPATVMRTLEGYLGEERMLRFLRDYHDTWRFRHPTTRDLQDVAERAAGEGLDWFFDQFVYGTAVVDYAVEIDSSSTGASAVAVRRMADGHFPVDVRIRFADGSTERLNWDGVDAQREFTFDEGRRVVGAHVDPDNKVAIDINPLNNRRSLDSPALFGRKVRAKAISWTQMLFYIVQGVL
jgi:aminopeptidase N